MRQFETPEPPINWGFNCLTTRVYHGRPESLWNLPLNYAIAIFDREDLKDLVVSRIYTDALIFVNRGEEPRPTEAWAEKVKQYAEDWFPTTLQHTVGEIANYYKSSSRRTDVKGVIERVKDNRLNPRYEPLHSHDSINMLCRILGTRASREASRDSG